MQILRNVTILILLSSGKLSWVSWVEKVPFHYTRSYTTLSSSELVFTNIHAFLFFFHRVTGKKSKATHQITLSTMLNFQSLANRIANTGLSVLTKHAGACVVKWSCKIPPQHFGNSNATISSFWVVFFHVPDKVCVCGSIACACTCKTVRSSPYACVDVVVILITHTHLRWQLVFSLTLMVWRTFFHDVHTAAAVCMIDRVSSTHRCYNNSQLFRSRKPAATELVLPCWPSTKQGQVRKVHWTGVQQGYIRSGDKLTPSL